MSYSGKLIINEFGNGFVNTNNKTIYISKKDIGYAYTGEIVNVEIVQEIDNLLYGKIIDFTLLEKEFTCCVHHYYKNETYLLCPKLTKSNLIIVSALLNENKWYNIKISNIENNKIFGIVLSEINNNINDIIESYFNLSNIEFNIEQTIENHIDQTKLYTFTIDPIETQDCDDAFSIKYNNDYINIYVHISDVANYINPSLIEFDQIIKRGTTIYGVNKNWPMIPDKYANHICSILPNKETLVYTHEFIFKNNQVIFVSSYYSKIISKKKFSYNDNNKDFNILYNASMILKSEFNEIQVNNEDNTLNNENNQYKTHELVKIWMIKINMIMSDKINKIYRCHPLPKNNNIKILELYTKTQINNRIDLVNLSKTYNNDKILQYLIKSSLVKAYYDVNNIGHYGIGIDNYTHWTSPIRRSCDLLNHCLIKGYDIDVTKYINYLNDSEFEQNMVENFIELYNIYNKIKVNDNNYTGIIINITSFGVSVYVTELETKYTLHISKLSTEKLIANENFTQLSNSFVSYKLFDSLKLKINKFDFLNVDFIVIYQ